MGSEQVKKSVKAFEDFNVFERAYQISLTLHQLSLQFPKIEQFALADQIRRASKSICANIAEGYGKQKQFPAEFRRFVTMSLGSSDEMRVWLRYCKDLGYISNNDYLIYRAEYIEISKMLQGLLNKVK